MYSTSNADHVTTHSGLASKMERLQPELENPCFLSVNPGEQKIEAEIEKRGPSGHLGRVL